MADSVDKVLREKFGRLLEKLREVQAQEFELVEEMQRLLGGEPGIGPTLKDLEQHYSTLWQARYGTPYAFTYKKDVPALKRLIKLLGVDELKKRMERYQRSSDQFYTRAAHSFGLFVATINQHTRDDAPTAAAPADCQHSPRCKSDAEHTLARRTDLRRF